MCRVVHKWQILYRKLKCRITTLHVHTTYNVTMWYMCRDTHMCTNPCNKEERRIPRSCDVGTTTKQGWQGSFLMLERTDQSSMVITLLRTKLPTLIFSQICNRLLLYSTSCYTIHCGWLWSAGIVNTICKILCKPPTYNKMYVSNQCAHTYIHVYMYYIQLTFSS